MNYDVKFKEIMLLFDINKRNNLSFMDQSPFMLSQTKNLLASISKFINLVELKKFANWANNR